MPFYKRVVEPNYPCRGCPFEGPSSSLEKQNDWTMISNLNQLNSLSMHMSEMFLDIKTNMARVLDRSRDVQTRLKNANDGLLSFKFPTCESTSKDGYPQSTFEISQKYDDASLGLINPPKALEELRLSCEPMPDFSIFDKYQQPGVRTSDLYSNPQFFFQSWQESVIRDVENQRTRRKRRKAPIDAVSAEEKVIELPRNKQREIALQHKRGRQESVDYQEDTAIDQRTVYEEKHKPTRGGLPSIDEYHKEEPVKPARPPPSAKVGQRDSSSDLSKTRSPRPAAPPPPSIGRVPSAPKEKKQEIIAPLPDFSDEESEIDSMAPPISPSPSPPAAPPVAVPSPPKFMPTPPIEAPTFVEPSPSYEDAGPPPPPPPPCMMAEPEYKPPPSPRASPKAPVEKKEEPPAGGGRGNLLDAIRAGKSLKKVEVVEKEPVSSGFGNDVYDILSKRIGVFTMNDSDEEENESNDYDWD